MKPVLAAAAFVLLLALTWFLVPTSFFTLSAIYLLIALLVFMRHLWRQRR